MNGLHGNVKFPFSLSVSSCSSLTLRINSRREAKKRGRKWFAWEAEGAVATHHQGRDKKTRDTTFDGSLWGNVFSETSGGIERCSAPVCNTQNAHLEAVWVATWSEVASAPGCAPLMSCNYTPKSNFDANVFFKHSSFLHFPLFMGLK